MTDKTNPRVRLDAALAAMRHLNSNVAPTENIAMEATVACAEALSLLVDAHLAPPEPEPEPEAEPDPRESLPDDTPVGHGWVMAWSGNDLFKPEGRRLFTVWIERRRTWGDQGSWHESAIGNPRPATVGGLRRVGLPVSEWPDITAPEPETEQLEAEAASALRAIREELAKLAEAERVNADARSAFRVAMHVVDTEARRRGLDLGVATA